MTEELKQAAQQATKQAPVLSDGEVRHYATCCVTTEDAIRAAEQKVLERALTQRPAAQAGERTGYSAPKGRYVPPVLFNPYSGEPRDARDIHSDPHGVLIVPPGADLVASLPTQPAAQAAPDVPETDFGNKAPPELVTLGPLAKRNIYDAIRAAYDLGYNDARNARTVPGDSAPGYDGRSVEEDHGSALFNLLSKRLKPATPEPVGDVRNG